MQLLFFYFLFLCTHNMQFYSIFLVFNSSSQIIFEQLFIYNIAFPPPRVRSTPLRDRLREALVSFDGASLGVAL